MRERAKWSAYRDKLARIISLRSKKKKKKDRTRYKISLLRPSNRYPIFEHWCETIEDPITINRIKIIIYLSVELQRELFSFLLLSPLLIITKDGRNVSGVKTIVRMH